MYGPYKKAVVTEHYLSLSLSYWLSLDVLSLPGCPDEAYFFWPTLDRVHLTLDRFWHQRGCLSYAICITNFLMAEIQVIALFFSAYFTCINMHKTFHVVAMRSWWVRKRHQSYPHWCQTRPSGPTLSGVGQKINFFKAPWSILGMRISRLMYKYLYYEHRRETSWLTQRISLAIQIGNSASVLSTASTFSNSNQANT
jgi:hypothetical protein